MKLLITAKRLLQTPPKNCAQIQIEEKTNQNFNSHTQFNRITS